MGRRWGATLLLAILLGLTACSSGEGEVLAPSTSSTDPATPSAPDMSPSEQTSPVPRAGELQRGPLKHTVRTSTLTVDVVYTPAEPVDRWTPDEPKPVQVQVTVHDRRQPGQKIYLTRATMRFSLDDGTGDIAGPDPLVDTASINPGYLVTSPYTYVQSFAIPEIDVTTRVVRIDMKLETVSLVDRKAKDYEKQTVTDTVTATPSF